MPSRVFAAAAAAAFLGLAASPHAAEFDGTAPATATVAARTPAPRIASVPHTASVPRTASVPHTASVPTAAKQTAAGRCTSLGQQVAAAVIVHFASRKLGTARKLAEEGNEDCARRKYSLGTRRLVEALEVLGVTPRL